VEITEELVIERYHPRVEANLVVHLLENGRAVPMRARDLSMAGIFLIGKEFRRESFSLALPLPGDRQVVTRCHIRRWEEDGVAVEFDQLDWDDLFALARFLHPRLP
jgi:hypothetical protein